MKTTIEINGLKIDIEYSVQPSDREVGIDNPYVDEFKVISVADSFDKNLCSFFDDYLTEKGDSTEEAIMGKHNQCMEESRYNLSAEDYEWTRYR